MITATARQAPRQPMPLAKNGSGNELFIRELLMAPPAHIFPYARGSGIYPPDTLYALYRAMAAEPKSLRRVLYEAPVLDLEAVMAYFSQTLLYLVVSTDHETVLGAVWFSAHTAVKAQIGIWYPRSMQGPTARDITRRVVEAALLHYNWRVIFGLTPWKAAVRHGLQIGFELVATIPEFVDTATGYAMPLYVVRRRNLAYCEKHDTKGVPRA